MFTSGAFQGLADKTFIDLHHNSQIEVHCQPSYLTVWSKKATGTPANDALFEPEYYNSTKQ